MVEFEVHELKSKKHYFNVCTPKKNEYDYVPWCVSYEVLTRERDNGTCIEEIRCTSGHLQGERIYSEATKTFLELCESLKARGWKL